MGQLGYVNKATQNMHVLVCDREKTTLSRSRDSWSNIGWTSYIWKKCWSQV